FAAYSLGLYAHSQKDQMAPVVAPLLERLQDDKSSKVRIHAAMALGSIGLADAVPLLVKALEDPDAGVNEEAVRALGQILENTHRVPPLQLLQALHHPNRFVRIAGASAIGKIGNRAKSVIRKLHL